MKKIGPVILLLIVLSGIAAAASSFQAAYERAAQEADPATAKMVSSIDLSEFAKHFDLQLTADEEMLIRTAMLAYTNGAMKEHPYSSVIARSGASEGQTDANSHTYIGNKSSKKFHETYCSGVSDIKEKNKVTLNSREEAIKKGYTPCKKCNP